MSSNRVVLPHPLGPMMAVIFPRGMFKLTLSRITRSPRLKLKSLTMTKGSGLVVSLFKLRLDTSTDYAEDGR